MTPLSQTPSLIGVVSFEDGASIFVDASFIDDASLSFNGSPRDTQVNCCVFSNSSRCRLKMVVVLVVRLVVDLIDVLVVGLVIVFFVILVVGVA